MMNTQRQQLNHEILDTPQRVIDPILSTICVGILISFFAYHQFAQTGFFTARFGVVEMLCIYGPILLSLFAPISRVLTGHRNPARPLQVLTDVCIALAAFWLLQVFPFDFAHLADALPVPLRFSLAWINDDIGRIVLVFQAAVGLLAALITTIIYLVEQVRASVIASDMRVRDHQQV